MSCGSQNAAWVINKKTDDKILRACYNARRSTWIAPYMEIFNG